MGRARTIVSKKTKFVESEISILRSSTILSITSAIPGWNVAYYDEEDHSIWFEPIACFALCEKYDASTKSQCKFVGSLVSTEDTGLTIAEDASNFLGIAPPGEKIKLWVEIAKEKFGAATISSKHKVIGSDDDDIEYDDDIDDDNDENDDNDEKDQEIEDNKPHVVSKRKSIR